MEKFIVKILSGNEITINDKECIHFEFIITKELLCDLNSMFGIDPLRSFTDCLADDMHEFVRERYLGIKNDTFIS
jgi:hypothetical protein